jgi:protein-disulfide isomerase
VNITRGAFALLAAACLPILSAAAAPQKLDESASAEEQRRFFTEDDVAPMVKPASYDVTIVEYMDYQCPYCRATHKPLKQLLAKDPKVRVIFRDWPVFGPASESAALIAIASKYQGKHLAVHDALMETPLPLTTEKIRAAVKRAGADWDRAQADIAKHSEEIEDLLARNDQQAQLLGLEGTPGFIIGDVQSFGGMTLKQLQESVADARKAAKGVAAAGKAGEK